MPIQNTKIIYLYIFIITILSCKSDNRKTDLFIPTNIECSGKNIENLFIICKIWGVVKYHHPDVLKGNINWDYELFKILPDILESSSAIKRNKLILQWLKQLSISNSQNINNIQPTQRVADFNWIENYNLGEVSDKLKKIINVSQAIYPTSDSILLVNKIMQYEKKYSDLPALPDIKFRLLTLFRYWNIVEYFFPYKYMIDENWDVILLRFIPEFIKVNSATEYRMLILKLITSIQDGHATIIDSLTNSLLGENIIPVKLNYVENKIIVTKNYIEENSLKVGDVILNINDQPVDSIINRYKKITPASNEQAQLLTIATNLFRSNDSVLIVTYDRDGKIFRNLFKTYNIKTVSKKSNKALYREYFNKRILYFNPTSSATECIPECVNYEGIIIDLRGNINLNNNIELDFLYSEPVEFAKFTVPVLPGVFVYKNNIQTAIAGKNSNNHFKGKLIIITNSETKSSAEFMAMRYKCASNSIIIGTRSAGANGDIITATLPGNIITTMSGLGVYYPDKTATQRIGIIPDIYIYPTISSIRMNQDTMLNAALYLMKKSIDNSEK